MKLNKKKLISITIALSLVIAAMAGTILTLKNFQDNGSAKDTTVYTKAQADALKAEGLQAAKANEVIQAKKLLQEARQIYIKTNDLDGVAGTDAQLYLIDHPRYPAK